MEDNDGGLKTMGSPFLGSSRPKQLIFDRRYGWIYEEWTDPVELANIGGRGMFSIVPLTAAVLDGTLHLANIAADHVVRALHYSHPASQQLLNKGRAAVDKANVEVQKVLHSGSASTLGSFCTAQMKSMKQLPFWTDSSAPCQRTYLSMSKLKSDSLSFPAAAKQD